MFRISIRFLLVLSIFLFSDFTNPYSKEEVALKWKEIQKTEINELNFKSTCDFIQDLGQSDLKLAYQYLSEYLSRLRKTGNTHRIHIILMNWAKAKESLLAFPEAENLYKEARLNAKSTAREFDEALVGTVLMYSEWGKEDSLNKYLNIGEKSCKQNQDTENLSFIYTFRGDYSFIKGNLHPLDFDSAIYLAKNLVNKNALFTALYNKSIFYNQYNLERKVSDLEFLAQLAKDSSLAHKPRFYERTAFYFRNPAASVYYQLILVNLLLTDYHNAEKFADLFYKTTIEPNPKGPQAPYFYSIMSMVKAYQGKFPQAEQLLRQAKSLFDLPDDKITYPNYSIAGGMIAEHHQYFLKASLYYQEAYQNGDMSYGIQLMPPGIYYAHGLLMNNQLNESENLFSKLKPNLKDREYSATGFYYYQYLAQLLKKKKDFIGYAQAQETFNKIKDSLTNLNHFRSIGEVETRMRIRDKEQEIKQLNLANSLKQEQIRVNRLYMILFSCLSAMIIVFLIIYGRNQSIRLKQEKEIAKQNELIQQNKLVEKEKEYKISMMHQVIEAEENERQKIAEQLHDETGGILAVVNLNLSAYIEKNGDDAKSIEKLKSASNLLGNVNYTIRNISHQLSPMAIEKYGLQQAIEDFSDSVNLSGKLKIETSVIGFENDENYQSSTLNTIYRIIQELVQNIIKHSMAKNARIELKESEGNISLIVEDDGIGISDNYSSKGKGLNSIQAKVNYLNGTFTIHRAKDPNIGTRIDIQIPKLSVLKRV